MEEKGNNTTCEETKDLAWMLTMTLECDVTVGELISSLIGLTAGPLWLVGHFLILSVRSQRSKQGGLPTWVTWSLLPHCIADIISCAGAILATQLFPQVVFAVVVLCVHVGVSMVIVLRHSLCSIRQYDLHGESLVNAGCAVSVCPRCPLRFCSLSVFMMVTLVSAKASAVQDLGISKMKASSDERTVTWPWWEVTGEVLGIGACLGHWIASLYEVASMRKPRKHGVSRECCGVLMMVTGNLAYLLTVLWRPRVLWLHTLPWTVTRVGLLGINLAMLIQLWRKARHKGQHSSGDEAEVDASLLSTSAGSEVSSDSDVLWDSTCKDRPIKFHKFQPLVPAYPDMQCFSHGRSPQPPNRSLTYNLLQSTDTSCSRTEEQDMEAEYEMMYNSNYPITSPHLDIPLGRLSPLTPEARQDRIVQWVVKSSPYDESHVTEMADRHAQCRRHRGSFSHQRSTPDVPSSRKNSSTF